VRARSLALVLSFLGLPATSAAGEPSRVTSVAYKTWIWPQRKTSGRFLGYARVGQSVALREPGLFPGEGCSGGFYAIEPRGWICNDRTVTTEATTDFLEADAHTRPSDGAFPYRYALSNGAPMYARVPTTAEQKKHEWRYLPAGQWLPLGMFQRGHEALAVSAPIAPADALPEFLGDGGGARGKPLELFVRSIPHGSMLSFTRRNAI